MSNKWKISSNGVLIDMSVYYNQTRFYHNYSEERLWIWELRYVLKQKNVLAIVQGRIYISYLFHVAIDCLRDILSYTVPESSLSSSHCFSASSISGGKISFRKINEHNTEYWNFYHRTGFPGALTLIYFSRLEY